MNEPEKSDKNVDAFVKNDRRMLAVLMDNLPGMVYRCQNNTSWSMDFVSQGSVAVTGYRPDELVHNAVISFGELIHPDDRAAVDEAIEAALNAKQMYQLEYRLQHRTMGMRWMWEQGQGVFTPEGELACLEGYITDITQRKTIQEQLQQSEEQFRRLAENAQDVIFRIEGYPEQRLVYVSPSIERVSGYSVEEYRQLPNLIDDMIYPEDRAKIIDRLARGDELNEPITVRWRHKDGRLVWTEQRNLLQRDDIGRIVAVEGVIRDITERKQTEETLQRKMAEEAALVAMLSTIIDPQVSNEQVAKIVLHHTLILTGSSLGYVSSIDPTNGDMISHTLTLMVEGKCRIVGLQRRPVYKRDPDGRYSGLGGHVINIRRGFFTNSPAEHPASRGVPVGHIPIKNFLAVPVMNGDDLLGQIAVANAAEDYCDADLEIAQRLTGFYSLYLQQWRLRDRLQASAAQLRRHNRILRVVAETASRFLSAIDWNQEMSALLAGLGQALDASRAFIFENYTLEDGEIAARQIYSWVAPGLVEVMRPEMAGVSYAEAGLARWAEYLSSGRAIAGQVEDFPFNEQALLARQGTKSLLAMPIFTGYDWYGYLGFGSDHDSQDWSTPEVDALQAAAGILGAAIERRQAEAALRKRTDELERLEKLVIGRELKMIKLKQRIQELEEAIQALRGSSDPSPASEGRVG